MKDERKTKKQLILELAEMRRLVGEHGITADVNGDKDQVLSNSDILYRTILETAPS